MAYNLSESGLTRMVEAYESSPRRTLDEELTFQVLSVKTVAASGQQAARNRLIISDGTIFAQSMLAIQHNHLVEEGQIGKYTVVKIKQYSISPMSGKRLIIILDIAVEGQCDVKYGEPANVENAYPSGGSMPEVSTSTSTAPPAATLVNKPTPAAQQSRPAPSKPAAPTKGPAHPIYPIESLSPYQNKWTIKARVTQKSEIRSFSTQKGEGKLFNMTLMDETGEIRATAFNTVVDDLYDRVEEGKVYFISKARVNIAKKKFASSTTDFEISLERNTEIEECKDVTNVPLVKFDFKELGKLEEVENNTICDVIGIVSEAGELAELTSKAGKQLIKRDITLVDKSEYSIRLTLWGKQAEQFAIDDSPVVAFKGVKVGDFGGRSLSMVAASTLYTNPDIQEAHLLRGWYDSQGRNTSFQAHQGTTGGGGAGGGAFKRDELKTCREVKESNLGKSENGDYFSCRGTVVNIKGDTIMYAACPGEKCSKKVHETATGDWRCEKCDRSYPEPEYRYLLSMSIADWTDQLWLQVFNEVGLVLFGRTAKDMHELQQQDQNAATDVVQQAQCKAYNFSCRAKQDNWNDQERVRYGVNKIWPLEYKAESRLMLDVLKQY